MPVMSPESAHPFLANGLFHKANNPYSTANETAKQNDLTPNKGNAISQISELAAVISSNTAKVNEFLKDNCLPFPSFEEDGPLNLGLSPEAEQARIAVLEASTEIHDLLLGPIELLRPTVRLINLFDIYQSNINNHPPDQRSQPRGHI